MNYLRQLYKQKPQAWGPPEAVRAAIRENAERVYGIDPKSIVLCIPFWGAGNQLDYSPYGGILTPNTRPPFEKNKVNFYDPNYIINNDVASRVKKEAGTIFFKTALLQNKSYSYLLGLRDINNADSRIYLRSEGLSFYIGWTSVYNRATTGTFVVGRSTSLVLKWDAIGCIAYMDKKAVKVQNDPLLYDPNRFTINNVDSLDSQLFCNQAADILIISNATFRYSQIAYLSDNPYALIQPVSRPSYFFVPSEAGDTITLNFDGKVTIKNTGTDLVDGLVGIKNIDIDLFDGKSIVMTDGTNLLDGKSVIKDATTNLFDGKTIIKDSTTDLLDGKIYVQGFQSPHNIYAIVYEDDLYSIAVGEYVFSGTELLEGKKLSHIAIAPDGTIYVSEEEGYIWKKATGDAEFTQDSSLGNWGSITIAPNGDVYAVNVSISGTDIYIKAEGESTYVAMEQEDLPWNALGCDSNGNIYAALWTEYDADGGGIYRKTHNGTDFSLYSDEIKGYFSGVYVSNDNDLYVTDQEYELIYKQTNLTGSFEELSVPSVEYSGVTGASNGDIYFSAISHPEDPGGSLYVLKNGESELVNINQPKNHWNGISVYSLVQWNWLDGKVVIKNTVANLADGLVDVREYGTNLFDGKTTIKYIATNLFDGKSIIGSTGTDVVDGKTIIKDSTTNLVDGKITIKDVVVNLLDGKTDIIVPGTGTNLLDGKLVLKDSAANLLDGKVVVLTVGDAANRVDGKIIVKDTSIPLIDGMVDIIQATHDVLDGLIMIQSESTDIFDGTIIVKNLATGLLDGKIIIQTSVPSIFDGKIIVKDISVGILHGKIVVNDGGTILLDGRVFITDKVSTNIFNGKVKISILANGVLTISLVESDFAISLN